MPWKLVNRTQPIASLIALFVVWKTFLLIIAASSPGPGYDTSTSLLFSSQNETKAISNGISEKLTRWDGIYFTKVARRGYLFEQEWAFGWGWTRFISFVSSGLRNVGLGQDGNLGFEGLVGVSIAHISHGLSVLVLYHLTEAVFKATKSKTSEVKQFAFITACLHIISPAGMFLSAPHTESIFSSLSFSGYYMFVRSSKGAISSFQRELSLVLAGLIFGLSVTIRSNGILNGILFLEEAVIALLSFKVRRMLAAGIGGALVGIGFLVPQTIAYLHFCGNLSVETVQREWCANTIPSIYTFVQAHYWNSGLFRYWTVSNIPLFLLAAPMFVLLSLSSVCGMTVQYKTPGNNTSPTSQTTRTLRSLALVQAVLGILTLVNAHVQIVTRLASAYPVWYWWTASQIMESGGRVSERKKSSDGVVRWMVMYAVIQGGLFASFLPPA